MLSSNGATIPQESRAYGPLAGVKVLDWTMWQFGPVAASMLGDMGADVIKLEALDGDVGRAVSSLESANAGMPNGRNAYFETCNRNKRGIAVNLKTEEGREIVHKLVAEADVVIENFRNGVAERLSMGYDTLKKINPRLVYASASGFGTKGPDALMPSLDACGQARAGLMMSATPPWAKHPISVRGAPSDQIGGIILCLGILSALWARESQGVGQKVEVSHMSSTMWLQGLAVGMDLLIGSHMPTLNREDVRNYMYNIYKCKDGSWLRISNPQPKRYWRPFVEALGLSHILDEPKFQGVEDGAEVVPELLTLLEDTFADEDLCGVGRDIPAVRVHLRKGAERSGAEGRSAGDCEQIHQGLRSSGHGTDSRLQLPGVLQRDAGGYRAGRAGTWAGHGSGAYRAAWI